MSLMLLATVAVLMICGVVVVEKSPIPQPVSWILQVVVILVGAIFIMLKMGWLRG